MSLELLLNQSMIVQDDQYPYSMQMGFETESEMVLSESITIHRGRIHVAPEPIHSLFVRNMRSAESSNTNKVIDLQVIFNGNIYTLKWIASMSVISADGQVVSAPMIHELHPDDIWVAPNGGKFVSFSMAIFDDIMELLIDRKCPNYVATQRAYRFRIGFVDSSKVGNAPVLGPVMKLMSGGTSNPNNSISHLLEGCQPFPVLS